MASICKRCISCGGSILLHLLLVPLSPDANEGGHQAAEILPVCVPGFVHFPLRSQVKSWPNGLASQYPVQYKTITCVQLALGSDLQKLTCTSLR